MSDISARLLPDPDQGVTLNADFFATAVMAYLIGDATAGTVRTYMNNHITGNGGTALTAQEESDIASMKTHYDGLTNFNKHVYRDKLARYPLLLQEKELPEGAFDNLMGI